MLSDTLNGDQEKMEISKSDWKLFRNKVGEWQNRYLEKICKEYIMILSSDADPSDKFWELEKRIRDDKRNKGVLLSVEKSNVIFDMLDFLEEEIISFDDLAPFSSDFKDTVQKMLDMRNY